MNTYILFALKLLSASSRYWSSQSAPFCQEQQTTPCVSYIVTIVVVHVVISKKKKKRQSKSPPANQHRMTRPLLPSSFFLPFTHRIHLPASLHGLRRLPLLHLLPLHQQLLPPPPPPLTSRNGWRDSQSLPCPASTARRRPRCAAPRSRRQINSCLSATLEPCA